MKISTSMLNRILTMLLVLGLFTIAKAQNTSVAERLGYDQDSRLLILHADDIGLAHSVNDATIKAFEESGISSASIMVPCPWFPEIAEYAKTHPQYDFGLHLTLTAEWEDYKWSGAAPSTSIPSLLDEKGFMYASVEEVVKNAKPEEVEIEIRAQIDRALDFGVPVTHLDSHMGTLFASPAFFEIYVRLGAEYGIPVFVPLNGLSAYPQLEALVGESLIPIDNYYMMGENREDKQWLPYYSEIVDNLPSGLNLIIVHLGNHDDELQAVTKNHPDFGSKWRENDLQTMLSDDFKKTLSDNNIQLVTWGQVKKLLKK